MVIAAQPHEVGDFHEGFARIVVDGLTGYMNTAGEILVEPQFADAGDFSEGMAWVVKKGKVGYIDHTGLLVIKPKYDVEERRFMGDFVDGRARVIKKERYGFIDRDGKWVIKNKYDNATDFRNGLARVEVGFRYSAKIGYYDELGNAVRSTK